MLNENTKDWDVILGQCKNTAYAPGSQPFHLVFYVHGFRNSFI